MLNIYTLSHDDNKCVNMHADIEKSQPYKFLFSSCYNSSHSLLYPIQFTITSTICQEEFLCNEEDIYQLLSFLDVTKANGTNGNALKNPSVNQTEIADKIQREKCNTH